MQPLIRYEVTDMLCKSDTPCACGRPFALVRAMGGRSEDVLRLQRADGAPGQVTVTPMVIGVAIEAFLGVREYVAEHDAEGIRIRLVVPEAQDRQAIEDALAQRLRSDIAGHGAVPPPLSIAFVDAIPRSEQHMGKISVVARRRGPPPGPVAGAAR